MIGLEFVNHDENNPFFLGYDLIDGDYHVSLLTNWGNDVEIINQSLQENALIKEFNIIQNIKSHVISKYPNDGHVLNCKIVSIYDMNQLN